MSEVSKFLFDYARDADITVVVISRNGGWLEIRDLQGKILLKEHQSLNGSAKNE